MIFQNPELASKLAANLEKQEQAEATTATATNVATPTTEQEVKETVVAEKPKEEIEKVVEKDDKTSGPTNEKPVEKTGDSTEAVKTPKIDDDVKEYLKSLEAEDAVGDTKKEKPSKKEKVEDSPVQEESNEYLEKARQYDQVTSNPLVKAFIDFTASGKTDPREFAEMVSGVDVNKMTSRQVYEHYLKDNGYSQEDIETELTDFDGRSKIQQDNFVKPFRAEIMQKNQEKVKAFSSSIESQRSAYAQQQMREAELAKQAMSELDSSIDKMANKKYGPLVITTDMAESIKKFVLNHTMLKYDEKGNTVGYDVSGSINAAVFSLYRKKYEKALSDAAKAQGMEEVLKARLRPDKVEGGQSIVVPDDEQERKGAAEVMRSKYRQSTFGS